MGAFRRFFDRLKESDETRLAAEIRGVGREGPGHHADRRGARCGEPVKLAGVVRRITVFPMEGKESLEALLFDGTGEVVVVFMGRRGIQGLTLGTRVVVEGVLGESAARSAW